MSNIAPVICLFGDSYKTRTRDGAGFSSGQSPRKSSALTEWWIQFEYWSSWNRPSKRFNPFLRHLRHLHSRQSLAPSPLSTVGKTAVSAGKRERESMTNRSLVSTSSVLIHTEAKPFWPLCRHKQIQRGTGEELPNKGAEQEALCDTLLGLDSNCYQVH
jgi:hypothetical protein